MRLPPQASTAARYDDLSDVRGARSARRRLRLDGRSTGQHPASSARRSSASTPTCARMGEALNAEIGAAACARRRTAGPPLHRARDRRRLGARGHPHGSGLGLIDVIHTGARLRRASCLAFVDARESDTLQVELQDLMAPRDATVRAPSTARRSGTSASSRSWRITARFPVSLALVAAAAPPRARSTRSSACRARFAELDPIALHPIERTPE
jgi:hypothetical protein